MHTTISLLFLMSVVAMVTCAGNPFSGFNLGRSRSNNRFTSLLSRRKSSLFGNRVRGSSSIFSQMSSRVQKPVCQFDKKGVPQMHWPGEEKLCWDSRYEYPHNDTYRALEQDPDAVDYMVLVQECYMNSYKKNSGSKGPYHFKDLCGESPRRLEKIWWTNTITGNKEVCYVIMPEAQAVMVAQCGGNCMMSNTEVKHHYCVPDGFVDRDIYVFCPGEYKQCRRTRVRVPTGCSCKKYECQKFSAGPFAI